MGFRGFLLMVSFAWALTGWERGCRPKEMGMHAPLRVGIVFDKGGKDDKSFNNSAYNGAMAAKDRLKVYVKYVEATDDNSFEPLLRAFAKRNYDVIIGIGFSQVEAMGKIAKEFPNEHFVIVDGHVAAPNVRSLVFAEHQGSFLVGAIAAWVSKTGIIGFIGGMDVPLIRRFQMGYEAGAHWANANIKIYANFVGVTPDAWNNPPRAKELALSQYESGADVIFQAAGASGAGLFDAAAQTGKLAIGVDSNQDWVQPGRVLTSMLKRVDNAVYATIEEALAAKTSTAKSPWGGTKVFDLSNGGIDYAVDDYNAKILPSPLRQRVEALKAAIIAGKVTVPDYFKKGAG